MGIKAQKSANVCSFHQRQSTKGKYLGLTLDSRLTFRDHIANAVTMCNAKRIRLYWLLNKRSRLALRCKQANHCTDLEIRYTNLGYCSSNTQKKNTDIAKQILETNYRLWMVHKQQDTPQRSQPVYGGGAVLISLKHMQRQSDHA